jgi:hypothetical protein
MSVRGWFTIGKYRILSLPLADNPAFSAYRIYLGINCIGRQLSVPCMSDCEWHESHGGVYACSSRSIDNSAYAERGNKAFRSFTISRRGRPTNAERARRLAYSQSALDDDPFN